MLPGAAAADAAEAPRLVQARLLALGPEEASVPQLAQNAGPLHRGLEPLQELLTILAFTQRDERQI